MNFVLVLDSVYTKIFKMDWIIAMEGSLQFIAIHCSTLSEVKEADSLFLGVNEVRSLN